MPSGPSSLPGNITVARGPGLNPGGLWQSFRFISLDMPEFSPSQLDTEVEFTGCGVDVLPSSSTTLLTRFQILKLYVGTMLYRYLLRELYLNQYHQETKRHASCDDGNIAGDCSVMSSKTNFQKEITYGLSARHIGTSCGAILKKSMSGFAIYKEMLLNTSGAATGDA